MTLTNRKNLPTKPEAELFFLAPGSNDALLNYDIYYYGDKLTENMATTTAKAYCVPPMDSPGLYAIQYRKNAGKVDNILDPLEFSVDVYDADMQHWDAVDHQHFTNGLISILSLEGFIEKIPIEPDPPL